LDCSNANQAGEVEQLQKETGYPEYPGAEAAKFSPLDGEKLAVVDNEGIHIVDIASK